MSQLLKRVARAGLARWRDLRLPAAAKRQKRRDTWRSLPVDPGIEPVTEALLQWLRDAQDHSTTRDGGAARHFSLISGWGPSYPETSGYIVPTLLDQATRRRDDDLRDRAVRMLDWLVSIQMESGGFFGGVVGHSSSGPVTFNTGQILLGLAAGAESLGPAYMEPMHRAASWLVDTQDADGAWKRFPTPFAEPGEKTYETHVAWGLVEAGRVARERRYLEAALRNARWAIGNQRPNGWFASCCLSDPDAPLTHTLGYALRGLVEVHIATGERDVLEAARKAADGLASAVRNDGFLSGRLDEHWRDRVRWTCLTGSAQVAHSLLRLSQLTAETRYHEAASRLLSFVRRTVQLDAPTGIRGGVKGSHPVDGFYCRYEYPNWACKFLLDAITLEQEMRAPVGQSAVA